VEYLSIAEGRQRDGLRLVLTTGVPGPWGEAIKALLAYKSIDYLPVAQEAGAENIELRAWTGQTSAPVVVLDALPPACHWLDQLLLLERRWPAPPLLPGEPEERALVVGLCNEIAGDNGFGWNRRLQLLTPGMAMDPPPENIVRMAGKYGWSHEAHEAALPRLQSISASFDARLQRQAAAGSAFLVGAAVTAADFYLANFIGMIKPLPPELNPMPDYMRRVYQATDEATAACVTPAMERHRDTMYERFIATPLEF
jgi:glutathione S-transferase